MRTRLYSLPFVLFIALCACNETSDQNQRKQEEYMTLEVDRTDSLLKTMNPVYDFKTVEYSEDPKTSTPEKVIKSDPKKTFMRSEMHLKIDDKKVTLLDTDMKEVDVFTLNKKSAKKSKFDEHALLYWTKLRGINKAGKHTDIWLLYLYNTSDNSDSELINAYIRYKRDWTEIEWYLSKN